MCNITFNKGTCNKYLQQGCLIDVHLINELVILTALYTDQYFYVKIVTGDATWENVLITCDCLTIFLPW